MPDFGDVEKFADQHDKQVDDGLEKAGDAAAEKVGHADEIDKGVDFAQQHTGDGDSGNS